MIATDPIYLTDSTDTPDLTDLTNIKYIGDYFLFCCSTIKSIDLTSLTQITQINNWFLSGCSNLETIDLTPLSNIISIGNCFLSNCSDSSEYFPRKYPTSQAKYRAVLPNYTNMKVTERSTLGEGINFYPRKVSKQRTDEVLGSGAISDALNMTQLNDVINSGGIEPTT